MALSGFSIPSTLTDDAGNTRFGATADVTGPGGYANTITTSLTTGAFRLGRLPIGDYTVTYNGRSIVVPVIASGDDVVTEAVARVDLLTQNTKTAAYTAVLTDAGTLVEFNATSAVAFTIPANASVAFPVGTTFAVRQYGAGQVTITAATGVVLRSRDGALKTAGPYAEATLTKRATDEWVVGGDVVV